MTYANACLKEELRKVQLAPEGMRSHNLFEALCRVLPLIDAGFLSESEVRDSMTAAARQSGLLDLDIEPVINSAFSKLQKGD